MALTNSERKERYYQLILDRANAVYASWKTRGATSKILVAQVYEYTAVERLKTDAVYRFHALVLAYALELRIEKRYATLLRKILHIFAFLRERNALRYLKHLLGFGIYTDMRELIEAEAEKLIIQLSDPNNRRPIGGGKRLGTDDLSIEEAFESFCEECLQEDLQNSDSNELENSETPDKIENSSSVKTDEAVRERISIEELDSGKIAGTEKETARQQETTQEKLEFAQDTAEVTQSGEEVKTVENAMLNSVILPEEVFIGQERLEEQPSPFPVFRETDAERFVDGKQDAPMDGKEQTEKTVSNKGEKAQEDLRGETEKVLSPFPVFNKGRGSVAPAPEKPMEQSIERVTEKPTGAVEELAEKPEERPLEEKPIKEAKLKEGVERGMKISEENKARIELNVEMSEKQIHMLATQIQESAKMAMAQEEYEWREKISIAENGNGQQPQSKEVVSPQNSGAVQGLKK